MLRSYLKGAASYVLPQARNSHADLFCVSASFSYSQFLRHLVLRSSAAPLRFGESVAELGPGSSLGFGLAALICGAARYQTFDVASHFDVPTNLRVFDELVILFRQRAIIPHEGEYVRIYPFLDDHAFPAFLTHEWMAQALAPSRLVRIRADIQAGGGETLKINIGLSGQTVDLPVDWLASHSVLEHVDDLGAMYSFMNSAIIKSGVMTHLIDFSSHGLTDDWNGHWRLKHLQWSILRGKRTYLINRRPLADHMELVTSNGFKPMFLSRFRRVDGLLRDSFSPEFRTISTMDSSTHMAFVICSR